MRKLLIHMAASAAYACGCFCSEVLDALYQREKSEEAKRADQR